MSPELVARDEHTPGFPRVSGDEPPPRTEIPLLPWFSPRERG